MSFVGKIEANEDLFPVATSLYGTCTTPAATAAKVVTLAEYDALMEGSSVRVKFTYSNTADEPTLNVNGTGALPIYQYGINPPGKDVPTSWAANSIITFTYDGDAWMMEDQMIYTDLYNKVLAAAKLAMWPVGSIYTSTNSTSPATLFGGTWERIKDKFLLAAGDSYAAGGTGGAASVTLTTSQIPAHTHGSKSLIARIRLKTTNNGSNILDAYNDYGIGSLKTGGGPLPCINAPIGNQMTTSYIEINASHEHTSVGGNGSHNNMPPYLVVYAWKRTA